MKDILRYTHIFYFVFTWAYVFIFIGFRRAKELLPVAVLAVIALTIADTYLISLNLYQFNKPILDVFGAPLFHLLWAGGAGIVFIHYMRSGFNYKLVSIVFFTGVTIVLEFIAESAGVASRLGSYSVIHSALLDFATLVALLWVAEGLYGDRIYRNKMF